jgi:hypothetical protein
LGPAVIDQRPKEHLTGNETVPLIRDCVQIVTEKSVTNRIFNILRPNSYRGDCCNYNSPSVPIEHKKKSHGEKDNVVITNNNIRAKHRIRAPLTVFHQNIRGLRGNLNELISHLHPTPPHVLCLSEHHM